MRLVLLTLLLVGCRNTPEYRAYCERDHACTGIAIDECIEGRKRLAEEEGACRPQGDALVRCMAEHARCERAGTMAFLFAEDACRKESKALSACRRPK